MAEETEGGIKRGCLIFIVVLVVLGAGAGLSVVIMGKSMKPKSRALVVSKPKARLAEVTKKLAPDMPADVKADFLKAFQNYTKALEKYGSQGATTLNPLTESLNNFESDGAIGADEAKQWTQMEKETMGKRP